MIVNVEKKMNDKRKKIPSLLNKSIEEKKVESSGFLFLQSQIISQRKKDRVDEDKLLVTIEFLYFFLLLLLR